MHLLFIGLATVLLLMLASLFSRKPGQVSSLSEAEREAWLERDRLAWMEKERQAKASPVFEPGGFSIDD